MNVKLTCFSDLNCLCLCEFDYYRAECFKSIDQCSLCLSNGYFLKGQFEQNSNDYLCLCPRSHYGKMFKYSSELMSFSLDSLIVKDMRNNHRV